MDNRLINSPRFTCTPAKSLSAILSCSREMYRVTEGLQREKQSLMKQLDLLRYEKNVKLAGLCSGFLIVMFRNLISKSPKGFDSGSADRKSLSVYFFFENIPVFFHFSFQFIQGDEQTFKRWARHLLWCGEYESFLIALQQRLLWYYLTDKAAV